MQARIQKWGNSLALRIPKSFAIESHIEQDTLVDVTLQEGRLIITPLPCNITLEALLEQVTADNTHSEQAIGVSMGQEAW